MLEELEYDKSLGAYEVVSKEEAWKVTGKAPMGGQVDRPQQRRSPEAGHSMSASREGC